MAEMKRYWLFYHNVYYAKGGMHDFNSDHDSVEEAEEATLGIDVNGSGSKYSVYDTEARKIICNKRVDIINGVRDVEDSAS
jgi:hypothetical protein